MNKNLQPQNKQEIINTIIKERNALDSLIDDLSIDQKLTPGVEAHWSIKDIMAHIAAWERVAQDRINAALTGEPLKFPIIESDNFIDDFNANIYEENKNLPLDEVEDEYHASHEDLLNQIKNLDEVSIQTYLPFDWAEDLTISVFISANTHLHYRDHASSILHWSINN